MLAKNPGVKRYTTENHARVKIIYTLESEKGKWKKLPEKSIKECTSTDEIWERVL